MNELINEILRFASCGYFGEDDRQNALDCIAIMAIDLREQDTGFDELLAAAEELLTVLAADKSWANDNAELPIRAAIARAKGGKI